MSCRFAFVYYTIYIFVVRLVCFILYFCIVVELFLNGGGDSCVYIFFLSGVSYIQYGIKFNCLLLSNKRGVVL